MGAYIKPIITKSDESNVIRMDFSKATEKPLITCDELDVVKREVIILENHIKGINKSIKISTDLSKNNNIKLFDEIYNISCKKTKAFLTNMENYIDVLNAFPKAPPRMLETKTFFNEGEEFTISIAEVYLKEVDLSSIPKPTPEQLEQIRQQLAYKRCQPAPNDTSGWERWDKGEIPFSQEDIDKITNEEAKEEYYNFESFKINKEANDKYEYEYIKSLTNKQLEDHYKSQINSLLEKKLQWQNILDTLNKIIYQTENSKGLATSNDFRAATRGTKKDLKWHDIDNEHRIKVKELLKSTAPEILEKLEDDENPSEIISQFIGINLEKKELRILKTIRGLVDKAYKLSEIQDYSHKVRIFTDDFYREYGFKKRKGGGYDDNQTHPLREILFRIDSNLTKRMFFNDSQNQRVLVTSFILKIEWTEKNNYFDVMLDDIIFVKDKADQYSYYYEDLKGFNRLLELMPNSDAAFNLHGYFEYSIKSKEQEFGLTKLLNHSGLINTYNSKHPTKATKSLEKILNNMIKVNTLISSWKKTQGKNEIKYVVTSIHCENNVVKLENKKQTTKTRNKNKKTTKSY